MGESGVLHLENNNNVSLVSQLINVNNQNENMPLENKNNVSLVSQLINVNNQNENMPLENNNNVSLVSQLTSVNNQNENMPLENNKRHSPLIIGFLLIYVLVYFGMLCVFLYNRDKSDEEIFKMFSLLSFLKKTIKTILVKLLSFL